jgi:hypothetical protein
MFASVATDGDKSGRLSHRTKQASAASREPLATFVCNDAQPASISLSILLMTTASLLRVISVAGKAEEEHILLWVGSASSKSHAIANRKFLKIDPFSERFKSS